MSQDFQHPGPLESAGLTDAELRAILYFAIGVTSEGGYSAYRLAVAGDRATTPILEPAENSGYTIGMIQTDLGQHYQPDEPGGENVPADLIGAYQAWAEENHPEWVFTDLQAEQSIADLGRNGRTIKAQHGRPLDAMLKSRIDGFLSANEGIGWVHARDVVQVEKLMKLAIGPLQRSEVYRGAAGDDQVRLAAIVGKVFNQNEVKGALLVHAIERGQYQNVEKVDAAVNDLMPGKQGKNDYLESGRDKALLGAEVLIGLRNAGPDNPLSSAWRSVLADPLINPASLGQDPAHPDLASEYPTIKGLFLHQDRALEFTESLERGGPYQNAPVDRNDTSRFAGAGFYAAGNDFLTWDRQGRGNAYVDGTWIEVVREDLSRVNNADRTVDINLSGGGTIKRLLHVDPDAPTLRPAYEHGEPVQQPAIEQQVVPAMGGHSNQKPETMQKRHDLNRASPAGMFDAFYPDGAYAALVEGDGNQLDRIAIGFAQSPEGLRLAQLGDRLLAQQQLETEQSFPVRHGPLMSRP